MKAVLAALALVSAAAPLSAAERNYTLPPYTPAYEPRTVDERGQWMQADEAERALQNSPVRLRDEKVEAYIRRVLCETVGHDRCDAIRIYVVENTDLNAFMMANGVMGVNTGLLLRARSEAELGSVLGHEFAHFELRHGLNGFKSRRTATDILEWAKVLGGLTNTNTRDIQTSAIGSIYSFSREQEQAADLLGLRYLGTSAYPSSAAARVWANLMEEQDATAAGRKLKKMHRYDAPFFATHPTELKRTTYLTLEAAKLGDEGDVEAEGHYAALQPLLPKILHSQVRRNDFGGTEYLLNSIAATTGWTGDLLFARGEMYQLRGNPRDFVTAAQYYREAISLGFTRPEAHRNLGITLLKSGAAEQARSALASYLQRAPDAADAAVIQTLIGQ